jgi:S-(hydroxymethyl)glutathione dehydrogenase/alcohol dehydrogenase
VLPEIDVAKIREDVPFDKVCTIGCGVTTGIGAVINTAKVEPGANVVVSGLGGIGLNVVQGAPMAGADMIIGVNLNPAREALARKFGMTHFVNPVEVRCDLVPWLVEMTGGGADYSFECIGNVEVMRQALDCCHRGRTDVPRIVDWYMEGKINIDDLVTHVLPLASINEGFDLMHSGESIRSVVVY